MDAKVAGRLGSPAPSSSRHWILLLSVAALEQLHRGTDAVPRFRAALAIDPHNTEAQNGLERAKAAHNDRNQ